MAIADQIESARQRMGLSQRELARRADIDVSLLSRIRAGKRRLTPDVARRLLAALESADAEQRRLLRAAAKLDQRGAAA